MSEPKTQKLPTYSSTSLLVSDNSSVQDEPVVEYKVIKNESTSLDEVFNYLFEKVQKEKEMT